MPLEIDTDIVVIGGGTAGCAAAMRSAANGLSTILVEAGFIGGTCLNSGCIPTKYLLGATAHLHRPEHDWSQGAHPCAIDLPKLQKHRMEYAENARKILTKNLENRQVKILQGKANFLDAQSLTVKGPGTESIVRFKYCIVATGSAPVSLPHIKADGAAVMGYAAAMNLTTAPSSMILVGGGPICLEIGCFFHRLGTKITLVDRAPTLFPGEEPEVGQTLQDFYSQLGWNFLLGKNIKSLSTIDNQAVVTFEDGNTVCAEKALIAIGRKPSTLSINAEAAGIAVDHKGFITVGEHLECAENIYAVGDCNGKVLLANAAINQAEYVAKLLTGQTKEPYTAATLPMCLYGTMEFLRVGETKYSLQNKGFQVNITKSFFKENHLAQSLGYPEGLVKAAWVNDELMGISAVGHGCSHLGSAAAMLVNERVKKNHDLDIAVPIPSLDETLKNVIVSSTEEI